MGVAASVMLAACSTGASSETPTGAATSPSSWSQAALPTQPMSAAEMAAVDAAVNAALKSSTDSTPGAWVGIWSPDKGVYVQAYGKATGTQDASVADHNYIGSLTKTATAVAVLQQVDAGRISLTDTVADLDPALAQKFPPIAALTVEQLLTMSSGLPDYGNEPKGVIGMVAADPSITFTPDDLIDIGLKANTIQPPGTPGYSTTNYIILGQILETVLGVPVEETVTAVFAQVGMTQSALTAPGAPRPEPASDGYLGDTGAMAVVAFGGPELPGDTDVTSWTMDWGRAGGGAYSTIGDLGLWGASGLGNTLLSPALGQARLTQTVETPLAGPYGYGIIDYGDGWYGHSGQVIGWEAEVRTKPASGAVIAVMVNSSEGLGEITAAVDSVLK